MNTFQCLVLIAAIGFMITASTVSAQLDPFPCYPEYYCKGTNETKVSSVIHHTTPSYDNNHVQWTSQKNSLTAIRTIHWRSL